MKIPDFDKKMKSGDQGFIGNRDVEGLIDLIKDQVDRCRNKKSAGSMFLMKDVTF